MRTTFKSHLISQVLLRRFAINNRVKIHNKLTLNTYLLPPNEIAYIDVPKDPFAKIESKYGYAETRIATAFASLDEGTLLKIPKHVESVKKFMALHYIRSIALIYLFSKNETKYFNQFIEQAKINHPAKIQEIDREMEILRQQWIIDLKKSLLQIIRSNIVKAENYINQYDIEIGIAPEKVSFALGDIPALNNTLDGKLGILDGVPIDKSDGFAMPLGPKHLAALITSNKNTKYRQLTAKEVGNCNGKIIKLSMAEYYTRQ